MTNLCRYLRRVGVYIRGGEPVADPASASAVLGEASFSALLRRCAIRHASKAVIAATFTLVMLTPSLLGSTLLAGLLVSMLVFGTPTAFESKVMCRLRAAAIVGCGGLALLWALAQYAVCNEWLVHATAHLGGHVVRQRLGLVGLAAAQVRPSNLVAYRLCSAVCNIDKVGHQGDLLRNPMIRAYLLPLPLYTAPARYIARPALRARCPARNLLVTHLRDIAPCSMDRLRQ